MPPDLDVMKHLMMFVLEEAARGQSISQSLSQSDLWGGTAWSLDTEKFDIRYGSCSYLRRATYGGRCNVPKQFFTFQQLNASVALSWRWKTVERICLLESKVARVAIGRIKKTLDRSQRR